MSEAKHEPQELKETLFCSFCNKSQEDVRKIISAWDSIFICDECVELCMDIIHPGYAKERARALSSNEELLKAGEEVEEAHGWFVTSSMFNGDNSREANARGKELSEAIQRLSDAIAKARGETE